MSRKFIFFFISILFIFSISKCRDEAGRSSSQSPDKAEPVVRIRIINTLPAVDIIFEGEWRLADYQGGLPVILKDNDSIRISAAEKGIALRHNDESLNVLFDSLVIRSSGTPGEFKISGVPYGIGWWWEGKEDRTYEGELRIYPGEDRNLEIIVVLPIERYLYGVLPYEIGGDSPIEALKAQAVAARSEAVTALRSELYSGKHHDLTSDVECQVFSGNRLRTEESDRAVRQTRGIILSVDGNPINAYYASNCGGHSEDINFVWPERDDPVPFRTPASDSRTRVNLDLSSEEKAIEWIRSEPDVYCNPNLTGELPAWSRRNFRWRLEMRADSISKMLSGNRNLGSLLDIIPLKRGDSGRIYLCRFEFEKGSFEIPGELSIRQMWSPPLRSSCFIVSKNEGKFFIEGAGWGHGVGMCQSGAVAMAYQDADFKAILRHYYPNSKLIAVY